MHLSTHEFVALAVDGELTKFLETQFGNDFGAHEAIIHLNQTLSQPAQFQFLGIVEMACSGNVRGSDCPFRLAVVLRVISVIDKNLSSR